MIVLSEIAGFVSDIFIFLGALGLAGIVGSFAQRGRGLDGLRGRRGYGGSAFRGGGGRA